MAGFRQASPSYLESVECAISHPKAWERLTLGHFGPFQALIQGPWGTKMAISTAKTRPKWQACSRLGRPTQKVSSALYQAQIHVRA